MLNNLYLLKRSLTLVLVPNGEQTLVDWNGVGYLVLDSESYAGEYMISGGLSGRGLNGGNTCITIGTAYILNILMAVIDLAEAICMTPQILTFLAAGTACGALAAAAVLVTVIVITVFSFMDISYTINLMDEYLEGNEASGQESISNAYLNFSTLLCHRLRWKSYWSYG